MAITLGNYNKNDLYKVENDYTLCYTDKNASIDSIIDAYQKEFEEYRNGKQIFDEKTQKFITVYCVFKLYLGDGAGRRKCGCLRNYGGNNIVICHQCLCFLHFLLENDTKYFGYPTRSKQYNKILNIQFNHDYEFIEKCFHYKVNNSKIIDNYICLMVDEDHLFKIFIEAILNFLQLYTGTKKRFKLCKIIEKMTKLKKTDTWNQQDYINLNKDLPFIIKSMNYESTTILQIITKCSDYINLLLSNSITNPSINLEAFTSLLLEQILHKLQLSSKHETLHELFCGVPNQLF